MRGIGRGTDGRESVLPRSVILRCLVWGVEHVVVSFHVVVPMPHRSVVIQHVVGCQWHFNRTFTVHDAPSWMVKQVKRLQLMGV